MRKTPLFLILLLICILAGSQTRAQQKITDPLVLIDTLTSCISREQDYEKRLSMMIRLAITYKSVGNYKDGLAKATEAVEFAEKIKSKSLPSALNMFGIFHKDMGNYDEAIKIFKKNLKLVEESGNKGGIAGTYNNLANIYINQGKTSEALEAYNAALVMYRQMKSKDGQGICLTNIATIYMDLGKYQEALTSSFAAYDFFFETGYKSGMGGTHNNIGDIYRMQGNYSESSKYLFTSLKYYEEAKDDAGRILSNISLGNLYSDQSNYEEALKYYSSGLKIAETIGDKKGVADCLSNIGFVYLRMEKYEEAMKSHRDALVIQKELEYKQGIATSLNNIGAICVKQKKYDEALKNLMASARISEELDDKSAIADTYNSIGTAYFEKAASSKPTEAKQEYQLALNYYKKAEFVADTIGTRKLTQDSYEGQARVYEKTKDFKKAYEYRTLYAETKDSLLNNETAKRLENLRIQYEIQKAQTDEQLKQEKQKTAMQLEFDRRADSIKYQQKLTAMQLNQQTFISKQQEQDLRLKQASLDLLNKQNELNRLNYLKSQAELETEQTKREEKENELTIANQEKSLQSTQLNLQRTQLDLKENQIQAEKKQRLFYVGGILLLILLFVFVYRNIRNRQRTDRLIAAERLKLEKISAAHKMTELELQSLRAQLNPHFMFNSLNAIQELILKEDNDNSHLYLSRFADLLRMLLDNANQPFVTLKKEINLLDLYLSLEKLRVTDLQYTIDIDPDIDTNKITIPNMMLQPYIENAIWHGLSHKKGEKNLLVRISKDENNIVCEVRDNGVGRKIAAEFKSLYRKEHRSRGMELLSKRFNLLSKEYGSDIQTDIEDLYENGSATGTKVAIRLPYSLAGQAQMAWS